MPVGNESSHGLNGATVRGGLAITDIAGANPVYLASDPSGNLLINDVVAGGGGGSPTGAAGGDLAGTYPNPTIGTGKIVDASVSASAAIAESKLSLASDAAAATASRRTLGTGATQAAVGNHNHGTWQASDFSLLAWSFDPGIASGGVVLGVAGTVYLIGLKTTGVSVTNVCIDLAGAGVTLTAGQCFAGLYQGGSLLGTTADQSASWTTGGFKEMALTGGPFAVTSGICYVGLFYNGTTAPNLLRGGATGGTVLNFKSITRWATADTGRTTTLPATLGATTAFGTSYWAGLS